MVSTAARLWKFAVALKPQEMTVERLAAALGHAEPPVIGCIEGDALLLNLRGVPPRLDSRIVDALEALGGGIDS